MAKLIIHFGLQRKVRNRPHHFHSQRERVKQIPFLHASGIEGLLGLRNQHGTREEKSHSEYSSQSPAQTNFLLKDFQESCLLGFGTESGQIIFIFRKEVGNKQRLSSVDLLLIYERGIQGISAQSMALETWEKQVDHLRFEPVSFSQSLLSVYSFRFPITQLLYEIHIHFVGIMKLRKS